MAIGADHAHNYDDWLRIGMSLTPLGPDGLRLWDSWSQQSPIYQPGVCEEKWATFNGTGLTLGTLFHHAQQRGWSGARGSRQNVGSNPPIGGVADEGHNRGAANNEYIDEIHTNTVDTRTEIMITTEEHVVIAQAIQALCNEPSIYQRSNALVRVLRGPVPECEGSQQRCGPPRITSLPPPRLRELMTKNIRWMRQKFVEGIPEPYEVHPPDWAVPGVLARGEWDGIRPLEAIVEEPVLLPDGTILTTPGYHRASWLLYLPAMEFPAIPDNPSLDDARAAVEALFEVVADFPFAGPAHRAAWLAALLTAVGRFAIAGPCPLFLFEANVSAAGKTLLCDTISLIATGREIAKTACPDNDEEMRKRITATALAGDRLRLFDNVDRPLGGAPLDAALTATTWSDRILGKSENANVPLPTVWFATGNNVALKSDMVRRVVPCRIEAAMERPEERSGYRHPELREWVSEQRGRLLVAALTILRAYYAAGKPDQGLPAMDFVAWSRLVRSAVKWATGLDPCETRAQMREVDPQSLERCAVLEGLAELPGADTGLTCAEMITLVIGDPSRYQTFRDVLHGWSNTGDLPSTRTIGRRLRTLRGQVVGDKRLRCEKTGGHTMAWVIETVDPGSGV